MFQTTAEIGFVVALLLPGFLVVQLSERRRPSRPAGGDLELILRGLIYALVFQASAAFATWLPYLVHEIQRDGIEPHLDGLALYGLVVCVVAPTFVGLLLGGWLMRAEAHGSLRWWHYALGGRDSRRAWDYGFSRHDGSWIRAWLQDPGGDDTTAVLGKFGKNSWASQSPADPDVYLQESWLADEHGVITQQQLDAGSSGGMWISADRIARIEFLTESEPTPEKSHDPTEV